MRIPAYVWNDIGGVGACGREISISDPDDSKTYFGTLAGMRNNSHATDDDIELSQEAVRFLHPNSYQALPGRFPISWNI